MNRLRCFVFFLITILFLSGCSHFWKRVADTHMPYKVIQRAGGLARVRFYFRPEGEVRSLHLVGQFNRWSFPGNLKGGKVYPLKYDKKIEYWVVDVWLKPGIYNYLYVVDCLGTVLDSKNVVTEPNGSQSSRIKVGAN